MTSDVSLVGSSCRTNPAEFEVVELKCANGGHVVVYLDGLNPDVADEAAAAFTEAAARIRARASAQQAAE